MSCDLKTALYPHLHDERHTIAVPGNVFSNFCLDYSLAINGKLGELIELACSEDDAFGRDSKAVALALKGYLKRMADVALRSHIPESDSRWVADALKDRGAGGGEGGNGFEQRGKG